MGKLSAAQSHVYTLLDKVGPVREIITQRDDEWEQWGLGDLMDNLKRFVERNPLTTNDCLKDGRTNHYGQLKKVTETWKKVTHYCWQNDITKTTASNQNVCTAIWTIIDPLNG